MEIYNVCRLCLSIDDLVHIFNEDNIKLKMRDVISITTGIEIHTKDIISQKVCGACYQFIIQMLQFRSQCFKSEKYLKDLCLDYLVDKKCYIPNTEVSIKSSVKQEGTTQIEPYLTKLPSINEIHPSIIKLSRAYPEIILPGICLTSDVAPIVQMEMNQVENYFEKLNLDFNVHVKKALLSAKKSEKATKNSKIQNLSEQNTLITVPKGVKITKVSGTSKPKKESRCGADSETRNKSKEVCGASNKNLRRNSKTLQSNPKRLSIEGSPKRTVETDTVNVTSNKKRKRDQDEETATNKIYGNCSATTRKRKLVLTENVSSEKTIDMGAVPITGTPKSATTKKSCAIIEKPAEEKRQPTENRTDLEKHSEVSSEKNDTCAYQSDDYESLTSVGKSKPLVVCQICNSVYNNMHELKKHQNKHMRCQFCKARFRSLERKKLHIEVCLMRKMMIDLPDVALVRIESDAVIRQKYSETFAKFSLHEQVSFMKIQRDFNNSPVDEPFFRGFPSEGIIVPDEAVISLPNAAKKLHPIVPNISTNVFSVMQVKASKNKVLESILSIFPSTFAEAEVQANLPTNDDINKIENDTVVLRGLLTYMSLYNIEVTLRQGIFNVTYDYASTIRPKPVKKMCLWDDLTPITIKSRDGGCGSSKAMTEPSSIESLLSNDQ